MNDFFSFFDTTLEVRSENKTALSLLKDRLKGHQITAAKEADLLLRIHHATFETEKIATLLPKQLNWERSSPLWGSFAIDTLSISDGYSLCTIRYEEKTADLYLSPFSLEDLHFLARTLLLLPICELLRNQGILYMHGALLTKDANTYLILGEGGSGKSTLAAALSQYHFQVHSDDNCLLTVDANQKIIAEPFETELSLHEETAKQYANAWEASFERNKYRFSLSHPLSSFQVTDLILLGEGIADPSYLFQHLLRENPMFWVVPQLASPHTKVLKALIQQSRMHKLDLKRNTPVSLQDLGQEALSALSS